MKQDPEKLEHTKSVYFIMKPDPKRLEHPKSVYFIWIFVLMILLFVLAGVINHLAFSNHGPGLLIPLVEKFQKKETPAELKMDQEEYARLHEHFHRVANFAKTRGVFQTTCNICHLDLPHSKNKKTRSMLNMHSNYLACETCHLDTSKAGLVVYRWYSTVEKNPVGPFFGTAYDPETGELLYGSDRVSKIVPFLKEGDTLAAALQMDRQQEARDYMAKQDTLSPEQRKAATESFHTGILAKGPECQTCHSSKSVLDLKALGFSEKRISDLQTLSIQGMFTNYDVFYLPDLFNQFGLTGSDGK